MGTKRPAINDSTSKTTPRGISLRSGSAGGQSIQIAFSFRGVQCREALSLAHTDANIKYASNLRAEILNKIERGAFNYADYFPDSRRARIFGHAVSTITVGQMLDDFIVDAEKSMEYSTVKGYKSAITVHLRPTFGELMVRDLTPQHIRAWVRGLNTTLKSIRNTLIPLRHVLEQALNDDLIQRNPLGKVVLDKLVDKGQAESDYEVDPFDEIERAAILDQAKGQARNLIQFAFYSGLRTSELIGLEWGDVDWINGTVRVQRAVVAGKLKKRTKTKAGMRDVLLLPPARQALEAQKDFTFLQGGRIFHHPITHKPYVTDDEIRRNAWTAFLRLAGVRYRNPYQTRHTYASMLLSNGENPLWVAKQMGHVDTEMITRTYGKWIPDRNSKNGYQLVGDYGQNAEQFTHGSHAKRA